MHKPLLSVLCGAMTLAGGTAFAGSFNSDFSNPNQTGITLTSNSASRPDGSTFESVIVDGHLVLTWNENSEQGTLVLNDLDAGVLIEEFTATFKLQIGPGSGTPADGFSFCFGPDIDESSNFGEEGTGTGIIVAFDIYNNGNAEAPAIDVKFNGNTVATTKFTQADMITSAFENVQIQLTRSGTINVTYKGQKVYDNLLLPDYAPITGRFALGARTGGENANMWVDDLSITTTRASAASPTVTTQPQSQTVDEAAPVKFSVGFDGSAPLSFQWLKDGVAITGATNFSYSIARAPLSANGAKYKCKISNASGSITSSEAVLTVNADKTAPALLYAGGTLKLNGVRVWFSESVDPTTAQTASNYQLSGGLTVSSATLVAPAGATGDNMVVLATSTQTAGQTYTLTVNGVKDQSAAGNLVAPASTVQFSAWMIASNHLLFEYWDNLPGAADADIDTALQDPRVVAGTPTTTANLLGRFDTRTIFPDDTHETYLAQVSGWITPAETGDYYFFLRSDDASRLYLSGNETQPNPATDTPICIETDCCDVFAEPESGDAATTAQPISLQAGKRYAVLALLKEGTGGDYMMVGWRKSTDTTPASSVPYIPGQFLSGWVDPNADLKFIKEPTDQVGVVASSGLSMLSQDFTTNDGGLTVVNTETAPPGPWLYDSANGTWTADGSEDGCTGPYNSQLSTPAYKLTQDGAVSLVFTHRYSFESDLYDAGFVRISVNGGAFTAVPADNFTDNGYATGVIVGNGIAKGLRAFNATSTGYSEGTFITTKAYLGTFSKDDTLMVQFVGAWDECSSALHPNWQIKNLNLQLLPMIIQDFGKSDGGFTVENTTPAPPGPWIYVATNGVWQAEGGADDCTGPYNSKLTSPAYTVPQTDEVTLTFTHRYAFESDYYDGGQVRISVNGGAFTAVPAENFSANGYLSGAMVGSGVLKGERAFNGTSTGYATNGFITSSAVLGKFNQNDKIVVQFLGAWDECSVASRPGWVIKRVQMAFGTAAKASTFEGGAVGSLYGNPLALTYQWQRNDGASFVNITGATSPSFRIFPTTADMAASFRLIVTVTGKTITSLPVKLIAGSVQPPTIAISATAANITIEFTGKLESASQVIGPYTEVVGATSPYSVPKGAGAAFYRSVK